MNEKLVRLIILAVTAVIHLVIIFFLVFDTGMPISEMSEHARIMRVIDIEEYIPPPPEPEIPVVEEIAEVMIETDTAPIQMVVAAGTIVAPSADDFLPAHMVTSTPRFDEDAITNEIIYPHIALRSGIEGRVVLDLFVDHTGQVIRITVLREEPEGRGFGEAAIRVFTNRKGTPAMVGDTPVSCRFRYPVIFRIR